MCKYTQPCAINSGTEGVVLIFSEMEGWVEECRMGGSVISSWRSVEWDGRTKRDGGVQALLSAPEHSNECRVASCHGLAFPCYLF